MSLPSSPLRYPGGKQSLSPLLGEVIRVNNLTRCTYIEPFAGGAGAALNLLFSERVNRLWLNDADRAIYAFWKGVLDKTDQFLQLVRDTPITVKEWEKQRLIYRAPHRHSRLRLGFATFYLNRCNRSGIIANGGVIGGKDQQGPWKLDARFNPDALEARILRIAMYRDRIKVTNLDGIELLQSVANESTADVFAYLDPPYYLKGQQLYLNHYDDSDHTKLAKFLRTARFKWVLSYDDAAPIRRLYSGLRRKRLKTSYSARSRTFGKELLIFPEHLVLPSKWKGNFPMIGTA